MVRIALLTTLLLVPLLPGASARKPRVLLLGDSNFFGAFGHRMADGLRENGFDVVLRAKSGSGLAFPGFHDWETLAPKLAERHDADAVVMMFGGNDGQSLKPARSETLRERIPWRDDPLWRQTYRKRIRRMARRIVDDGRRFILLSPTNRRPRRARERMQRVIEEQRAALHSLPMSSWLDTWGQSSRAGGNYEAWGRSTDG
ncbi:MAG: hypothetical protein ACI9OJ_003295, partial [Myxococcota bacterium]